MAEYYPLLARAVSSLPDSTPDTRRAVYERARKALLGQLRATQPPVPEADIERENKALDDAVTRLEAELAVEAALAAPPVPAPAPPPAAIAPAAPPLSAPRPIVAPPPAPPAFRPIAPPRPPAPLALEPAWPTSPKLTPAGTPAGTPVAPPSAPAVQPLPETAALRIEDVPPPPDVENAAAAPARWQSFGRPRAKDAATDPLATHPPELALEAPEPAYAEPLRPPAPVPPAPRANWLRPALIGGGLLAVVAVVGALAYKLRDNPTEFVRGRTTTVAETTEPPASSAKIVERIGGGAPPRQPTPTPPATRPGNQAAITPAPAPAAAPTPAPAPANPDPALPVGQRAALLVEAPDEAQRVKTWYGSVVWKLETPAGGGLPQLRADVEIAEARLSATVTISRSPDVRSPASHIINVRFVPGPDSPVTSVSEIEPPSMRMEDRPVGDPLEGKPLPVTANYFLVGLMRDTAGTARNIDLIKSRGWIDVPMRLNTGKIAKITFEKGPVGERLLNEALAAWQ